MKTFEIFGLFAYLTLISALVAVTGLILHKATGLWIPGILLVVVGNYCNFKIATSLVKLIERMRSR